MRSKQPRPWMLIFLALVCQSAELSAQHYQPFGPIDYTPSLQPFAPVSDVELNEGVRPNEGYFFSYERMNWAISKPDRAPIGANVDSITATVPSTLIYFGDPDVNTIVVSPPNPGGVVPFSQSVVQVNTVDNAISDTEFGWGNRFNLGYLVDDDGWVVSIIGGMKQNYEQQIGFDEQRIEGFPAVQGLPGRDGIVDDQIPAVGMMPMDTAPVAATIGLPVTPATVGYVQASVIFLDPMNLLQGFIDFNDDSFADDINMNGVFGNAIDTDADGTPDTPAPVDAGDLVTLATIFDDMLIRNRMSINSVELMKIKRLEPTHHGSIIELFYGVRYLELDDRFSVDARGGVLADSDWQNRIQNRMVGPQIGFRHYNKRRRWTFSVEGRFTAAVNFAAYEQSGTIGSQLVPGEVGKPLSLAPTSFSHTHNTEEFSPVGELRVSTDFQLTRAVSLTVGWTGLVAGGVTRASNTILYQLPSLGIVENTEEIFSNGVNFGVIVNR